MSEGPPFNLLTAHDSYLFNQGSHFRLYDRLGARVVTVLALCNFTPMPRDGFRREALNSDAADYGGSGVGNRDGLDTETVAHHGRPFSLVLPLPPLSVSFFVN